MSLRFSARNAPASQFQFPEGLAAHARLPRARDDLHQWRIAANRIRQAAGVVRVRAAELDRRWRAAAFRIARIQIHRRGRAVSHAGRSIEAAKSIVSVERTGPAARLDEVMIVDRVAVITSGNRHVPCLAERERIGRVETPVAHQTVEIDSRSLVI